MVVVSVLGLSLSSSIYSTWSVPVLMNFSVLLQLVKGEAFRAIHGLSVWFSVYFALYNIPPVFVHNYFGAPIVI